MNCQGDAENRAPFLQAPSPGLPKGHGPLYPHTPTETQSQMGRGVVPHRSKCPPLSQDTVKLHGLGRPDLENKFSGRETDASGKLSKLP